MKLSQKLLKHRRSRSLLFWRLSKVISRLQHVLIIHSCKIAYDKASASHNIHFMFRQMYLHRFVPCRFTHQCFARSHIGLDSKNHNQLFYNALEFQQTRSSDMDGPQFVSLDRPLVLHRHRRSRSCVPAIRRLVIRSLTSFLSTIVCGPLCIH